MESVCVRMECLSLREGHPKEKELYCGRIVSVEKLGEKMCEIMRIT